MLKVKVLTHTPNPEQVIATAAKLCYSNSNIDDLMEKQTPEKVEEFLDKLLSLHHESPLEHISFTFAIEGVSRSLTHQLTRHRIASYSQQSQRYVSMEEFNPIVPLDIKNNEEALEIFNKQVEKIKDAYNNISDALLKQYLKDGLDTNKAKKKACENARAILPNACETKIIVTMNARSLMNFFKHRCCERAQTEIQDLAWLMLFKVKAIAPILFKYAGPSCISGKCPEGAMSCGKPFKKMKVM